MKKEDIFAKAYSEYKQLLEICESFYVNVIENKYPDVSLEKMLYELDIYLQSILVGVAASDEKFESTELIFIDQLTDYGNIFDSISGGVKTYAQADKKVLDELKQKAYDISKDIPMILKIVALMDKKDIEYDFTKIVMTKLYSVMTCLIKIDGLKGEEEQKLAIMLLDPLLKLFPTKDVMKLLKKKD